MTASVSGARVTGGHQPSPKRGRLIAAAVQGPGTFVSAFVSKMGGTAGFTTVYLTLDGNPVVTANFESLSRFGFDRPNPYGVALLAGDPPSQTVAIGFSAPLSFERSLELAIDVGEPDVGQVAWGLVHGS
jgi:hypothetical protein